MEKDFNHDNPENWRWSVFYFNRTDSRYIVPKRFKSLGWTFNFAHPISWIIMGLILAAVIFSLYQAS
ncbi:MAG: DUF5808 domain-containing protein [Sphingobacteriaceae bacterium]